MPALTHLSGEHILAKHHLSVPKVVASMFLCNLFKWFKMNATIQHRRYECNKCSHSDTFISTIQLLDQMWRLVAYPLCQCFVDQWFPVPIRSQQKSGGPNHFSGLTELIRTYSFRPLKILTLYMGIEIPLWLNWPQATDIQYASRRSFVLRCDRTKRLWDTVVDHWYVVLLRLHLQDKIIINKTMWCYKNITQGRRTRQHFQS